MTLLKEDASMPPKSVSLTRKKILLSNNQQQYEIAFRFKMRTAIPIQYKIYKQLARQSYIIEMNRVQELIIQALTTAGDNKLRQQAENTIFSLLRENSSDFFLTCARIAGDEQKKDTIRQSAASVMKAVLVTRNEHNDYMWDSVPQNIRTQIKGYLLSNLMSNNILVMRAGANVIAQIAAIEISRGEWLGIVNSLAANSMHSQLNVRRASITTLGFICEELKLVSANINQTTCEQILGSLLLGLEQEGDIVEISLTAIRESISFLRNILQNQECSTKLFRSIFPLLATAYSQKVYEILYEFGKYCYHLLDNYITLITEATIEHIRQRNENAARALQLWDTIGTEYIRRIDDLNQRVVAQNGNLRNFVQELHEILLPEVMGSILILEKSDLDHPQVREGAVRTLGTLVSCCGRDLVEKVTDGVSRVIGSPNPGERQASALLFSCLCQYQDKAYIEQCFLNGFKHLYQLIDDPELIVKKNTLNGFITLAQSFPHIFLQNSEIVRIVNHLIKLSTSDDEDVQVLSLTILTCITDELKDNTCSISTEPDHILKKLMEIFTANLDHNQHKESNQKIIIIIMNIVMSTSKKDVLMMLITHLITLYSQYSQKRIDREIVHGQIIAIIHTCILSLSKYTIDSDLKRKIYGLIDQHIKNYGVEQEGINLISASAICFKKEFLQDQFDQFWSIIVHGLEQVDQKLIFKASLACISDISRTHQNKIAPRLGPVFKKLIAYMHGTIDRELKTEILKCFGDLCLGLKSNGGIFIETLIQISNECFDAVYKLSEIQNEKQYAQQLKQSLIEMYHCVLFALNEQNSINTQLASHFPIVSTFIVKTCDVKLKPTVDYLKICLYLIFDSALFYSKHKEYKEIAHHIIKSSEVTNLVNIIRHYQDRPDVNDILVYIDDKLRNQRR